MTLPRHASILVLGLLLACLPGASAVAAPRAVVLVHPEGPGARAGLSLGGRHRAARYRGLRGPRARRARARGSRHRHGWRLALHRDGTLLAVGLLVLGHRRRARLLGPVAARTAWSAAMAGGAVDAIVGSVVKDSGPLLLVIGVVVLAAATAYVANPPAAVRT